LSKEEKPSSWQEALSKDPEYYMNDKQGQQELADMIRRESERLLVELSRSVKRTREIIWLSRYCTQCKYFKQVSHRTTCSRWDVQIVKPFYGKVTWARVPSRSGDDEKEQIVSGIDWSQKWREISDRIIEWAVDKVNGGIPYFCYTDR
jgi:hypothetical protein